MLPADRDSCGQGATLVSRPVVATTRNVVKCHLLSQFARSLGPSPSPRLRLGMHLVRLYNDGGAKQEDAHGVAAPRLLLMLL